MRRNRQAEIKSVLRQVLPGGGGGGRLAGGLVLTSAGEQVGHPVTTQSL